MKKIRNVYFQEKYIENGLHKFLLLFHFKIENKNYFTTYNEFLYTNSKNKYSILGYLDDSFKIDLNSFHFLIEYPETSCYISFTQNVNPLNAPHNSQVGYDNSITNCTLKVPFSGLTKFNGSNTYLDGYNQAEYDSIWHYPIGQRTVWVSGHHQIPAYLDVYEPKITEVNFWIKINSLAIIDKIKSFYSCKQSSSFHVFHLYYLIITIIK